MTTDLDDWKAFLTRFGIGFEVKPLQRQHDPNDGIATTISMVEGMANVNGYIGYATVVAFDESGRFLRIGAWE